MSYIKDDMPYIIYDMPYIIYIYIYYIICHISYIISCHTRPTCHGWLSGCGGRSLGARRLEGLHLHQAGGRRDGRDTVAISLGTC